MDNFQKLPDDDFMYDKVDFNFLVEINMLTHFINLASGRISKKKSNHLVCEVFIILKNLIDNHLPSMTRNIVSTEKSQNDIDQIIKNNRKMIEAAVDKEVQKEFKSEK